MYLPVSAVRCAATRSKSIPRRPHGDRLPYKQTCDYKQAQYLAHRSKVGAALHVELPEKMYCQIRPLPVNALCASRQGPESREWSSVPALVYDAAALNGTNPAAWLGFLMRASSSHVACLCFVRIFRTCFNAVSIGWKISGLLFKISGSDFKIRATNFFFSPMRGKRSENQFSIFST